MKPSDMFSKMFRDESRFCQNVNAAALLQEVAAWLDGGTIFDGERQELWEHADRLCGAKYKLTLDRPSKPGAYWCLSPVHNDLFVRHFSEVDGVIVSDATGEDVTSTVFTDMKFAGPIGGAYE